MSSNIKIGVLVACLAIFGISVKLVQSGFDAPILPPSYDLADLPMELGGWSGSDTEISDATVQVLGAHSHLNRNYSNRLGKQIGLHIAIWSDSMHAATSPHHPEICYCAVGWEIIARRQIEVETEAGVIPVELIQFQREKEQVTTAHWFQMGSLRYHSSDTMDSRRLKLWGKSEWPSTEKILLQLRSPSLDVAEPTLREFTALLASAIQHLETGSGDS